MSLMLVPGNENVPRATPWAVVFTTKLALPLPSGGVSGPEAKPVAPPFPLSSKKAQADMLLGLTTTVELATAGRLPSAPAIAPSATTATRLTPSAKSNVLLI
jgi:hypothetical protein